MPLAPPSALSTYQGDAAAMSARTRPGLSTAACRPHGSGVDEEATLAELNAGRREEQPDSDAGRHHVLSTLDWQTGSTLLFRGKSALHDLHEFLINQRLGVPFYLSLQLLAPQPFTHGAPFTPRVLYQPGRRRRSDPSCAPDGAVRHTERGAEAGGAEAGGAEDTIRLEDAERGGPALVLPCVLRRLSSLLQTTQGDAGFDMVVQPDSIGGVSDALNLGVPRPSVRPRDLGVREPSCPQPRVRMRIGQAHERRAALAQQQQQQPQPQPPPPQQQCPSFDDREARPRCVRHVRCIDGELHLISG